MPSLILSLYCKNVTGKVSKDHGKLKSEPPGKGGLTGSHAISVSPARKQQGDTATEGASGSGLDLIIRRLM